MAGALSGPKAGVVLGDGVGAEALTSPGTETGAGAKVTCRTGAGIIRRMSRMLRIRLVP